MAEAPVKKLFAIGNGESRKDIDLTRLSHHITTGCNALFRDFAPTYLISVDITLHWEIVTSGYADKNICYFRDWITLPMDVKETIEASMSCSHTIKETWDSTKDRYYEEFVCCGKELSDGMRLFFIGVSDQCKIRDIKEATPRYDYSFSGPTALDIGCALHPEINDVWIIGYDFSQPGKPVNNIYKDTKWYRKSGDNENDFICDEQTQQVFEVISAYPNKNFYHLVNDKTHVPEKLRSLPNYHLVGDVECLYKAL